MFNNFLSMVSQSALFSLYTVVIKEDKIYGADYRSEETLWVHNLEGKLCGKNQIANLISFGTRLWYVNWTEPVHGRVQCRL
jgi:hypothetical protein